MSETWPRIGTTVPNVAAQDAAAKPSTRAADKSPRTADGQQSHRPVSLIDEQVSGMLPPYWSRIPVRLRPFDSLVRRIITLVLTPFPEPEAHLRVRTEPWQDLTEALRADDLLQSPSRPKIKRQPARRPGNVSPGSTLSANNLQSTPSRSFNGSVRAADQPSRHGCQHPYTPARIKKPSLYTAGTPRTELWSSACDIAQSFSLLLPTSRYMGSLELPLVEDVSG